MSFREDNRVIDYLFHTWDNANLENKRAIFDTIENGFDCVSITFRVGLLFLIAFLFSKKEHPLLF